MAIYPPLLRTELGEVMPQVWDGANWQPYGGEDAAPLVTTLHNNSGASGVGNEQAVSGYASAAIQLSGAWAGTVTFQGSVDGANWVDCPVLSPTGARVTSATVGGIYRADVAGLAKIRTPWTRTSGNLTVVSRALPEARSIEQTVQLSGRKEQVTYANYDQTLDVPAGGATSLTVTPPAGELWRIRLLYIHAPAPVGATSGTHVAAVAMGELNAGRNTVMELASKHTDAVWCRYNHAWSATSGKLPATAPEQQMAILNTVATKACPLVIRYANNTNVNQTQAFSVTIGREVEYVNA